MSPQPVVKFGLLGKTLAHSFSKKYFSEKFRKEGLEAVYENFELNEINQLEDLIESEPLLLGFNVTFPFKKAILPYLDFQDETVRATGACNTVCLEEGYTFGYNSDVKGFLELFRSLNGNWNQSRALILGTGGAAAAVGHAFDLLKIPHALVSRSDNFDWSYGNLSEKTLRSYNLVVQATPLGTFGQWQEECPPIPYNGIHEETFCIDLNYNPEETVFLRKCKARGAHTANGRLMLRRQAEESWRIWHNYDLRLFENKNMI
jgi:shikimate dehydrogenase